MRRLKMFLVFLLCFLRLPFFPVSAQTPPEPAPTEALTFVNLLTTGSRFDRAADLFHAKYPEVELVRRNVDDMETLATEMMAGLDGVDLIAVQESAMFVSAGMMLRAGAILDLNRFDSLTALRENYRDIWGWTTLDGQWFGVPERPSCPLWQVNPALAEAIGWEISEGRWTWADFAALGERVKAYNQAAERPILLFRDGGGLLPYFLQEYQANHVSLLAGTADFMTEAYTGILALWQNRYFLLGLRHLAQIGVVALAASGALDAAALDGDGEAACFFRIRLPMIGRELSLALAFLLMYFLRIYKECYLLFGQYTAEALYLVQHYMNNQYLNLRAEAVSAAAVSLTLLALALYGGVWGTWGRRRGL